jgi:hypothetical protein
VLSLGLQPTERPDRGEHTLQMPEADAVERKRKRKDKDAKVRASCASARQTGGSLERGDADQGACSWFVQHEGETDRTARRCAQHDEIYTQ